MKLEKIIQQLETLPLEGQQQVADFIITLQHRYKSLSLPRHAKKRSVTEEPFIGMWKDREDLKDSTTWIHNLRQREWRR